jgi:hypothetical protein
MHLSLPVSSCTLWIVQALLRCTHCFMTEPCRVASSRSLCLMFVHGICGWRNHIGTNHHCTNTPTPTPTPTRPRASITTTSIDHGMATTCTMTTPTTMGTPHLSLSSCQHIAEAPFFRSRRAVSFFFINGSRPFFLTLVYFLSVRFPSTLRVSEFFSSSRFSSSATFLSAMCQSPSNSNHRHTSLHITEVLTS